MKDGRISTFIRLACKDVTFLAYANHGLHSVRYGDVAGGWLVECGELDDPLIGVYHTLWEALDEMALHANVPSEEFVIILQQ